MELASADRARAASELRAGAVEVAERLRAEGFEAWFAGGCVRDLLLGSTPKDWDIATDARPEQVQAVFPRTVPVGAAFGVIQVLQGRGRVYEVATFRADGDYEDGRRPTAVHYSSSRQQDVRRRDFTINALLMDPTSEEILDYVDGQSDLRAGLIRAVGDPSERFGEDRLRMLRAVRFAARLGFAIEDRTWRAIAAQAPHLTAVSPERVTQELEGIWTGPRPGEGERMLEQTGLARVCLPEARPSELARQLDRLPDAGGELEVADRAAVGWALVHAHQAGKRLEGALRARKLSRAAIRAVQDCSTVDAVVQGAADPPGADLLRLVRDPAAPRRRAYLMARHGADSAAIGRWDAGRARLRDAPPVEEAFLTGTDLQALGLSPGPRFKALLRAVEGAALEGRARSRSEALDLVRGLVDRPEGP